MPPEPDIEILSQIMAPECAYYRVRVKQRVHYLTILSGVFDKDTMRQPDLLLPKLPELPDSPWTTMTISRGGDGSLKSRISTDQLPGVKGIWHDVCIDIFSLKWKNCLKKDRVYEVEYEGAPAVAKIACFEWCLLRIERETWAYSKIESYRREHPDEPPIAPEFLGHLTENGRTIGFLLEKVNGKPAVVNDLANCEALLRRLHRLKLVHGDPNTHNFIVDRASGGKVRLIDFETAMDFDEYAARDDLDFCLGF
ncbi:alpha-galactosidase A [Penicillium verhagenii]|uniref:alpha-galactosidase A n=1 Tax=Penicillium verhagenii TaxID=1562060 RepID=UPI0025457049|nr:alpha-galactosidase A [Penicillium verhagenii]KAJ5934394.1 alpha-galactosidase A [Penicillium verhagenii]